MLGRILLTAGIILEAVGCYYTCQSQLLWGASNTIIGTLLIALVLYASERKGE